MHIVKRRILYLGPLGRVEPFSFYTFRIVSYYRALSTLPHPRLLTAISKMALKPIRINDIGVRPLIVGVVFVLLATIAVLLRMVSCRLNGRSLYADDYMIGLALVSFCRIVGRVPDPIQVLAYGCGFSNIVGKFDSARQEILIC